SQGTAIQFQLLPNQESQPFFPAFTSWEELRRLCGPKNQQTLVLTFADYAGMILRDNRAAGFVVDPLGSCLSFDRAMVEHLVRRKELQSNRA
ncbi:MAG: SseB family protein, partial [Lawsonibacter sp.]|nr:SseB family protein [Lawsonibacter sp.]